MALAFGPLGLLYANVAAALTMVALALPLYAVTRGGLWFNIIARIVCVALAIISLRERDETYASQENSVRLLDEAARLENVDRAKAIAAYEEVIKLFPDTPASREATRNIRILSLTTPKN